MQSTGIDSEAVAKGAPVTRISAMASGMQWIGKAVDEPDFYVWCTSPIMGEDGKVHLFCARWPKQYGMNAWYTHSEIAHYIGEKPEGPFLFANKAMESNPDALWNNTKHNPAIFKFGDTWVLLYSTFDRREKFSHPRGRVCTCMATSKSLHGPWTKQGEDGLIVFPSKDPAHYTCDRGLSNPTMLEHNGKYYIYFLCGKDRRTSRYGCAVSSRFEGPYQLTDQPCTDNVNYIEDGTAFKWNGKCYLLTNDNFGTHTGVPGRGILWQSESPVDFKLADAQIGFLKTSDYCKNLDLSKARPLYGHAFKFERPGLLLIQGNPAYFYGPSGVNLEGSDHTCSYVMKVNM